MVDEVQLAKPVIVGHERELLGPAECPTAMPVQRTREEADLISFGPIEMSKLILV